MVTTNCGHENAAQRRCCYFVFELGRHISPIKSSYARDYLRHVHRKIGDLDMGKARLRHLENRPTLPKFYRRLPPSE